MWRLNHTHCRTARTRTGPAIALTLLLGGCEAAAPQPPVRPPDGVFEGLATGSTRAVDLTHTLNAETPYWPGPGYEPFAYETFSTIEEDGVLSGRFSMAEHTGTHLDAPNHFVPGRRSVDRIPAEQLIVPTVVIDARAPVLEDPDYELTREDILVWERSHGRIPAGAVVMMYTGWDERWPDFERYQNRDEEGRMHFPGFSPEAASLAVAERGAVGLGIDTLSVDYGLSEDFQVHHLSHEHERYHLENVANLGQIPPTGAWIIVAPIKIEDGTGGPARIFALVPEGP